MDCSGKNLPVVMQGRKSDHKMKVSLTWLPNVHGCTGHAFFRNGVCVCIPPCRVGSPCDWDAVLPYEALFYHRRTAGSGWRDIDHRRGY